jgi:hypothetical protein
MFKRLTARWDFIAIDPGRFTDELRYMGIDRDSLPRLGGFGDVAQWARQNLATDPALAKNVLVAAWRAANEREVASLVRAVSAAVGIELTVRFLARPRPERQDWENLFNPVSFSLSGSPHYWFTLMVLAVLSVVALLEITPRILLAPSWMSFRVLIATAAALSILGTWHRLIVGHVSIDGNRLSHEMLAASGYAVGFPFLFLGLAVSELLREDRELTSDISRRFRWSILMWGFAPALLYYVSAFASHDYELRHAAAGWLILALLFTALWRSALRRDRLARNPLSGVLDRAEDSPSDATG